MVLDCIGLIGLIVLIIWFVLLIIEERKDSKKNNKERKGSMTSISYEIVKTKQQIKEAYSRLDYADSDKLDDCYREIGGLEDYLSFLFRQAKKKTA